MHPCGAERKMIWVVILTFVITALSMLVLLEFSNSRKLRAEIDQLTKSNDDLRRRISKYSDFEKQRRENSAYAKGIIDSRKAERD